MRFEEEIGMLFDDNYFSLSATTRIPFLHPSLTLLSRGFPHSFLSPRAILHLLLNCGPLTLLPPGETELGSAGTQPNKG